MIIMIIIAYIRADNSNSDNDTNDRTIKITNKSSKFCERQKQ